MGYQYSEHALEVGQQVETVDGVCGEIVDLDSPFSPVVKPEGGGRLYGLGTVELIKRIFLPDGSVMPWPPAEGAG